jgi:hypothetical protein
MFLNANNPQHLFAMIYLLKALTRLITTIIILTLLLCFCIVEIIFYFRLRDTIELLSFLSAISFKYRESKITGMFGKQTKIVYYYSNFIHWLIGKQSYSYSIIEKEDIFL